MNKLKLVIIFLAILTPLALGVEPGSFRLLSLAKTSKLILISSIPQKTKYVLDASAVKITVDGKPAEFNDLRVYSVIRVKFEPSKSKRGGIKIDGRATEIMVKTPDKKEGQSLKTDP